MSHSTAAIKFKDGTILHGEYNGTVDVLRSPLYTTQEEARENWRTAKWISCNNKEHEHHEVEIAVSYGGGYIWPGKACKICMCVTDGFVPHPDDESYEAVDGLPDWYPNIEEYRKYYND